MSKWTSNNRCYTMEPLAAQFISQQTIQAICWTIVHSMWLGVVLAFGAALVVQFTRKAAPALRYNLLAAMLLLFLVASTVTFCLQLQTASSGLATSSAKLISMGQVSGGSATFVQAPASLSAQSILSGVTAFCNQFSGVIVLLWFIVFTYKSMRIMAGIRHISHLRSHGLHSVPAFWLSRVSELAGALQIKLPVRLQASELVSVPLVVGFVKPMILVPAGMLAQIAPEQVEAILLHELAHISRRDYLINLLQSFAEVVFFFNPGLLWVSSLIRQERENCCDDMAIKAMGDKRHFLKALVSFQEYSFAKHALAPAFAERQASVSDRVKRIIYKNNTALQPNEKLLLVAYTAVTAFSASVFLFPERVAESMRTDKSELVVQQPLAAYSPTRKPTLAEPFKSMADCAAEIDLPEGGAHKTTDGLLEKYRYKNKGVLYEVAKHGNAIIKLSINGEELGPESYDDYNTQLKSLQSQYRQGKIAVVVNGQVPAVSAEPENPVFVDFIRNGTITTNREGVEYVVRVRNHKTVGLAINQTEVAVPEIQHHRLLIEDLVQEALADRIYAELSGRALEQLNRSLPSYENKTFELMLSGNATFNSNLLASR